MVLGPAGRDRRARLDRSRRKPPVPLRSRIEAAALVHALRMADDSDWRAGLRSLFELLRAKPMSARLGDHGRQAISWFRTLASLRDRLARVDEELVAEGHAGA